MSLATAAVQIGQRARIGQAWRSSIARWPQAVRGWRPMRAWPSPSASPASQL